MVGQKVQIRGEEALGFGEIESSTENGTSVRVRFYSGPNSFTMTTVSTGLLSHDRPLPAQTRCFVNNNSHIQVGRILGPTQVGPNGIRAYWVQLPNQEAMSIPENQFHVIGYRGEADPVGTLAYLGHETPFFAVRRLPLFGTLLAQHVMMKGLTSLSAARIELFEHQVEITRRILLDPKMRYLLADEVGLGKTIEAGIVLAQLARDCEGLRAAIYAPQSLCVQWQDELDKRFSLADVPVLSHQDLAHFDMHNFDIVVIDEAHRLVAFDDNGNAKQPELTQHLRKLAQRTTRVLLLTATPILSRDKELLSLLSILDPESYSETDLPAFQRLLGLRQDIGRSIMALDNVTMPSMIRSQVGRVQKLLPHDDIIADLAQSIGQKLDLQDRDAAKAKLAEFRLHLAETYRVHHRMLRTRRKSLAERQGIGAARIEKAVEFDVENVYQRIWELVEEYRIIIAAQTPETKTTVKANEFLRFVELLTTSPAQASVMCEYLGRQTSNTPEVKNILKELSFRLQSPEAIAGRFELLHEVLTTHLQRNNRSKLVVFCTTSDTAAKLADYLRKCLGEPTVATVNADQSQDDLETEVLRFREEADCCVLVSDSCLEEGRNLQFASGMILFDLPFSPMRLEQRIGRLDRLDRVEPIPIKDILTIDDDTLALDTAWYKCLVGGFGLFEAPMSDLQLLIDDELPRIAKQLFRGGATAISALSHLNQLRQQIQREREHISEQDIIDGLRLDSQQATETWDNVQNAEQLSGLLTTSTAAYLHDSLRFDVSHHEGPGFTYALRDRQEPLIPLDRLLFLTRYTNREFTASRLRSARHEECELFRCGHPLAEDIMRFLKWDDRGRAFAFWRRVPLFDNPVLVFRVWVVASVDINSLDKQVYALAPDDLGRASLQRLLGAWFSPRVLDFSFDAYGRPAPSELLNIIEPPYDRKMDINLGGTRSHTLIETFGEREWPATCQLIGRAVIETAKQSKIVMDAMVSARSAVAEHFRIANLRLAARSRAGADTNAQSLNRQLEMANLHAAIDACMASPLVKIDTLGAYVLSAEPICER